MGAASGDALEGGGESLAGQDSDAAAEKFVRGFLAERASFTLESNQGCGHRRGLLLL
jgi:hypothetical protein